jgi:thiol-disulfide isomerase/thioredoxin
MDTGIYCDDCKDMHIEEKQLLRKYNVKYTIADIIVPVEAMNTDEAVHLADTELDKYFDGAIENVEVVECETECETNEQ